MRTSASDSKFVIPVTPKILTASPACATSAAFLHPRRTAKTRVVTNHNPAVVPKNTQTGDVPENRNVAKAPPATDTHAAAARLTPDVPAVCRYPAKKAAVTVIGAKNALKYGAPTESVPHPMTSKKSG